MPDNSTRASFDKDGVQWAWDSTSLKAADTCLRKYYYEIIEGWQRPYGNVNFWFGGIYASSLETFHKQMAGGASREDAIRIVIREAMVATCTFDEEGNFLEPTTFDNQFKTRETLIRTLIWYFDSFEKDHFATYITSDGKPAVEHSFQLPVDNLVSFCGHIDRLVTDPEGEIFAHDQKTTGTTIGPHYFKQFKPDIQFALYTFAGKAIYDLPVKGVIVDAAQIAVGFSRFARHPILYTNAELDEWYEETMSLIDMAQAATIDNYFPRRPASCLNYGGCTFREVCSRPKGVRDNFLRADFVKRESLWDPVKAR